MMQVTDTLAATTAAAPPLRVECIHHRWGFTALRPHWNELLRASAADVPFLTWDWVHTWWTHLGDRASLRIVTVWAGNQLVAVAPMLARRAPFAWLSRLELLGTGHAGSDYLDFIVRRGHEAAAVPALAHALRDQGLAVKLDHLRPGSLAAQVAAALAANGWIAAADEGGECPILDLAGHTWDSFLGTLGSAHRANVRRRLRALERQFRVRFEAVTTDGARREALATLMRFHEQRWDTRGGSTAFLTPALRTFHHEVTRRALERGWLRMYVLWLDETPAAVMYGFLANRQFYFYQHGFDDRYRDHSVGLVLMALSVRAALDEGAHTFDMLWGLEPYKRLWARETRVLEQIQLFPPHLGGRLHRGAVRARRRLGRLARRVLNSGDGRAS